MCVTAGSPADLGDAGRGPACPAMPASKRGSSCTASAAPWRTTASVPSTDRLDSCARIGTGTRARSRASSARDRPAGSAARCTPGIVRARRSAAASRARATTRRWRRRGCAARRRPPRAWPAPAPRPRSGAKPTLRYSVRNPSATHARASSTIRSGSSGTRSAWNAERVAPRAAPQAVQRLARGAAGQIPERGVDARQRPRHALRAEVRHAGLGVQAAADRRRGSSGSAPTTSGATASIIARRDLGAAGPYHRRLADAHQTLVRDQLHQHGLQRIRAVARAAPARRYVRFCGTATTVVRSSGDLHRGPPEHARRPGRDARGAGGHELGEVAVDRHRQVAAAVGRQAAVRGPTRRRCPSACPGASPAPRVLSALRRSQAAAGSCSNATVRPPRPSPARGPSAALDGQALERAMVTR